MANVIFLFQSFSSFWGLSFFSSLYVIIAIGRCVPLPPWLLFLSLPLCLLSLLQEDVCHYNPSLFFFLSLFVYHCCYKKVCAIVTSVHLSFSPSLFIVVVIKTCAPSDLDSCLFFSLFVCCCYYRKVCAIVTLACLSFFLCLCWYKKVCAITTLVHLSFSPSLFYCHCYRKVCIITTLNPITPSTSIHMAPWLIILKPSSKYWSLALDVGVLMQITKF
jgi:hypothetical protein